MLDRQLFRTDPDLIRRGCARKGIEAPVDDVIRLDGERRELLATLERQQAEMNRISKTIGQLMAQGKREEAEAAKAHTKDLKEAIAAGEQKLREIDAALRDAELLIPNLPHDSVPDGLDETCNVVLREWGEKPAFAFEPKAHWDLGAALGLLDLPRGAKVAGSGFPCYVGLGARLQRALFQSMIEFQTRERGYTEVYPPYLVNRASMVGTGNFPKFEEDVYRADEDLWLIPTAEVPVTNLYRDEILTAEDLTLNLAAFSGCFRREAGAAGKDTRGLLRVHQFDKVELVKFCKPEDSYDELEKLTADAEAVLKALGLHYRVVAVCAGDMGFKGAKQYDLEVWAPGVGRYLEVSSCSNFEAFQARRANIRFRREQGAKPEFVHILNGSGLACPRLFAAVLETYQREDGSVDVPDFLRPWMGVERIGPGE
ncbi:MAG: serine--tRNA ligase [Fimbriimonadales bacterium]|nr:serine--tRNA ligase [Fimbriimonadales bacterium]